MDHSLYIDIKYAESLRTRLLRFKQTAMHKYTARCPICGDSTKSKTKVRFNIYNQKGELWAKCYNCGYARPFRIFLSDYYPDLYADYMLETFSANKIEHKESIARFERPKHEVRGEILAGLKRISQLPVGHPARMYIESRQLPTWSHAKLYFTAHFSHWINGLVPDKFQELPKHDPRVVIPLINRKGEVFAVQGRAIIGQKPKYLTVKFDESIPKIFGLESVDPNRKIFVVEGPIDSFFLPNAIAMTGAEVSIEDVLKYTGATKDRLVFVLDNQPRNPEVIKHYQKLIDQDCKIVIWPKKYKDKDINACVESGHSPLDLTHMFDDNTYKGLEAQLQFTAWRKF